MNNNQPLPGWISGLLVAGTLGCLVFLEKKFPLRRPTQNKLKRNTRNIFMASLSAATIKGFEKPIAAPLTRIVEKRRWGLVKQFKLNPAMETTLAVVLMDYTLYIWHYLTHKVPFLWRFHEVHHADLDLDATTAIRFHAGEMALSVPWRALQIVLIGVSPKALSIWQTATTVEILFHHSNVRLPEKLERWLNYLIVTPRMHGIHHSTVRQETDSNWSTILSFADRLHNTLRLNVPQGQITIGIPAFEDGRQVTLGKSLGMPFRKVLWEWTRPGQSAPKRERRPEPQNVMVS